MAASESVVYWNSLDVKSSALATIRRFISTTSCFIMPPFAYWNIRAYALFLFRFSSLLFRQSPMKIGLFSIQRIQMQHTVTSLSIQLAEYSKA
jgi:hypothetical protein